MSDRAVGVSGWMVSVGACLALVIVGLGAGTAELTAAVAGSLLLLALRVRLTAPYAFVVGQVTLVATTGEATAVGPILLAEVLLCLLLFEPDLRSVRRRSVPTAGIFGVVAGGIAWSGLVIWGRLWGASLLLLGTGGLIGYLLYRYEYVQLGVVSSE